MPGPRPRERPLRRGERAAGAEAVADGSWSIEELGRELLPFPLASVSSEVPPCVNGTRTPSLLIEYSAALPLRSVRARVSTWYDWASGMDGAALRSVRSCSSRGPRIATASGSESKISWLVGPPREEGKPKLLQRPGSNPGSTKSEERWSIRGAVAKERVDRSSPIAVTENSV